MLRAVPAASPPQIPVFSVRRRRPGVAVRCAPDGDGGSSPSEVAKAKLKVGSPIVVVAPLTLKTAASMPSLRFNAGQVKAGDVGRIIARKPKDVWTVRLAVGRYLPMMMKTAITHRINELADSKKLHNMPTCC